MEEWRGRLNAVLYGLIFDRKLDEESVSRTVYGIVEGSTYTAEPRVYIDAVTRALDSSAPLNSLDLQVSEVALRDFLTRLLAALNSLDRNVDSAITYRSTIEDVLDPDPDRSAATKPGDFNAGSGGYGVQ